MSTNMRVTEGLGTAAEPGPARDDRGDGQRETVRLRPHRVRQFQVLRRWAQATAKSLCPYRAGILHWARDDVIIAQPWPAVAGIAVRGCRSHTRAAAVMGFGPRIAYAHWRVVGSHPANEVRSPFAIYAASPRVYSLTAPGGAAPPRRQLSSRPPRGREDGRIRSSPLPGLAPRAGRSLPTPERLRGQEKTPQSFCRSP